MLIGELVSTGAALKPVSVSCPPWPLHICLKGPLTISMSLACLGSAQDSLVLPFQRAAAKRSFWSLWGF